MSITIKSKDLRNFKREQRIGALLWGYKQARGQFLNGEVREVRSQIEGYEKAFGISSRDVHAALDDGRLQETMDVCRWIMAIDRLESLTHDEPTQR